MTDPHFSSSADILDHIRAMTKAGLSGYHDPAISAALGEAADEIERLRRHKRLQAEDIMTLGQEVGRLTTPAQGSPVANEILDLAYELEQWIRQPDWAETFSLQDMAQWASDERPIHIVEKLRALAAQTPAAPVETAPHLLELRGLFKGMEKPDAPFHDHERSSAASDAKADQAVEIADKIDLHLTLSGSSPGFHLSEEELQMAAAALRFAAMPDVPQTPLIKGAVYELGRFGPAEYVGLDEYHGETTHKFRMSDRRPRYIKPDELASLLSRPNCGGGK